MKKLLFCALCAGALLTGCSSDEPVSTASSPKGGEITFNAAADRLTRADPATLADLQRDGFSVWGYNQSVSQTPNAGTLVFDGQAVTYDNGSSLWTYTPLAYWIKDTHYWFSATTGTSKIEGLNASSYGHINFTNNGNVDLLYAKANCTTPTAITIQPPAVQFTFKHALCRIKFRFELQIANKTYNIGLANLKLTGTPESGNFQLDDATWSNLSTAGFEGSYASTGLQVPAWATGDVNYTDFVRESEFLYYIPTNSVKAAFDISLFQKGIEQVTFNHLADAKHTISYAFQPGHSYVITCVFKVKGGDDEPDVIPNIDPDNDLYPIEFTVTAVDDFVDGPDQPLFQ